MSRLEGKVAIITGSASGIGEATARRFIKEEAKVVIADIAEEGKELAEDLGENALFLKLDVSDEENWKDVIIETENKFGPVNILVNNAGILGERNEVTEQSLEDYKNVININQVGTFLGIKTVQASMLKEDGGSIINLSSINGLIGLPGQIAYDSSKFAVRGMTKTAAQELSPKGIRVNSVHPGPIATGIDSEENQNKIAEELPSRRVGQPEEIANMILYLATDEASYSTGAEFVVDGGMTS